jgi:hypothetical protein
LRSHRDEALERFAPGVEYEEAVARLDQPTRHVEAHLAEPDEADIHRDASLPVIAFICANLSRTRGAAQARPRRLGKALEVVVRCEHHAPRRRVEAQGGGSPVRSQTRQAKRQLTAEA